MTMEALGNIMEKGNITIQGVQIKCFLFYRNIVHEPKGGGIKTLRIW
jgi:hypothetical protein